MNERHPTQEHAAFRSRDQSAPDPYADQRAAFREDLGVMLSIKQSDGRTRELGEVLAHNREVNGEALQALIDYAKIATGYTKDKNLPRVPLEEAKLAMGSVSRISEQARMRSPHNQSIDQALAEFLQRRLYGFTATLDQRVRKAGKGAMESYQMNKTKLPRGEDRSNWQVHEWAREIRGSFGSLVPSNEKRAFMVEDAERKIEEAMRDKGHKAGKLMEIGKRLETATLALGEYRYPFQADEFE